MLRLTSALLAACLMSGTAMAAPDQCTRPDDRAAFDTEGLKSELMVTALACKQQDKFNAFMIAYRPHVALEEKNLGAYFKRVYGKQYQKAYDDYITNLGNVQEQDGLKAGTAFCENFTNMFDEVMSLHDSSELIDYARSQTIMQPVAFQTCSTTTGKPTHLGKSRHKARHNT